jgi:predicted kinase
MKTILILRGLPASGKTTYAKNILAENPHAWKRLNKDELRAMLDNSAHSYPNEKFVANVRDMMLVEALKTGKHVVIDDTNLSERAISRIKQVIDSYCNETGEKVQIQFKDMETTLEESLERDKTREKKVGEAVIMKMYKQHILKDERGPHYQEQDDTLLPVIICDIDGTLAIINDRSPFDASRCEQDLINTPIAEIVKTYHQLGVKIILMSGRDENFRSPTTNWLSYNKIPYDELFMRKAGDQRKDSIVKKELFEAEIRGKYFVKFVLDDRNQVVDLWRLDLGLPCLQVNYGDF